MRRSSRFACLLWTGFDLVLWKDAASGQAFSPAMTETTQSCFAVLRCDEAGGLACEHPAVCTSEEPRMETIGAVV